MPVNSGFRFGVEAVCSWKAITINWQPRQRRTRGEAGARAGEEVGSRKWEEVEGEEEEDWDGQMRKEKEF